MQSIQDFIHPSDVDFFAEDEKITIEPNFNMEAVTFISGTLGPFKTLQKTEVPLWLAVELKQKRKCNIVIPSWLTVNQLEEKYERESAKNTNEPFEVMNYYYMEIAAQLLEYAADDFENVGKVRRLIEDIWTSRTTRIRKQMEENINAEDSSSFRLGNLASMELKTISPILTQTISQFRALSDHMTRNS
eukprot:TRINITY_DN5384_c0_g1_i1.p1 TRINITY_DN5384_c0_g1~~TRINITY_DN5384_c0_g1_i1.p1  ORF type:complete len:189 (-),score=55.45 TRINITY_DN5384_c0_g1_i1:157-723(-)